MSGDHRKIIIIIDIITIFFTGLMQKCTSYLDEHFESEENSVGLIYETATKTQKKYLASKALEYIARHLNEISKTEHFLKYLPTTLESILSHPCLNVACELQKVDAVVYWLNHEWSRRCSFAWSIFQFLDFCLIPEKQLMEWCLRPDTQLVLSNDGCLRRVHRGFL